MNEERMTVTVDGIDVEIAPQALASGGAFLAARRFAKLQRNLENSRIEDNPELFADATDVIFDIGEVLIGEEQLADINERIGNPRFDVLVRFIESVFSKVSETRNGESLKN